jgi:hypothetical protein
MDTSYHARMLRHVTRILSRYHSFKKSKAARQRLSAIVADLFLRVASVAKRIMVIGRKRALRIDIFEAALIVLGGSTVISEIPEPSDRDAEKRLLEHTSGSERLVGITTLRNCFRSMNIRVGDITGAYLALRMEDIVQCFAEKFAAETKKYKTMMPARVDYHLAVSFPGIAAAAGASPRHMRDLTAGVVRKRRAAKPRRKAPKV